jgi:mono/diheme cytochrome c family protein
VALTRPTLLPLAFILLIAAPAPLFAQAGHDHAQHQHGPAPAAEAGAGAGRQVFVQNCAGCHGANAEGKVGPKLAGTAHSEAEIRQFVTRGIPPKMPAFGGRLPAQQIAAVAAYVKSLGPPAAHDHSAHQHGAAAGPHAGHAMEESWPVGRTMSRLGSGTAWLPESSPMWMKMARSGRWSLMQHGDLKIMVDGQGGPRGVTGVLATNSYMVMGRRELGKGEWMVRAMLSLEPLTIGNNGQPQLFQTGEGLTDRQHPHDLFMEAATQYTHPIGSRLAAYLYAAPVGEPALGPVAFMHRPSAIELPTGPLVHHWTDSTHISYGVLTAGVQSEKLKLEGSWFNGHEPDARRWKPDALKLNSYSGRLSYAPNSRWVFQVSRGHLDNPEVNYPDEHQGDVDRTTASVMYVRPMRRGFWATTLLWGRNERDEGSSDGFLLETNYNWADRNYVFGRIERVEKDELFPPGDPRREREFTVNAFSLGYARDIGRSRDFETALGVMGTVHLKDSGLDGAYGDFPVGVQLFLRIRPRRMNMTDHGGGQSRPMEHHHGRGEHRAPGAADGASY